MHYAEFAEDEVRLRDQEPVGYGNEPELTCPSLLNFVKRLKNTRPTSGRSLDRKLESLLRYGSDADPSSSLCHSESNLRQACEQYAKEHFKNL